MRRYFRSAVFWTSFLLTIIYLSVFQPIFSIYIRKKERLYLSMISFLAKVILLITRVPVELTGKENLARIDQNKALLIAANHASFLDYFVLQAKLPLVCKYVVWWAGFRVPFLSTVFKLAGYIGVKEKGSNIAAAQRLYRSLKRGENVVIFSRPVMSGAETGEFKPEIIKLSLSRQVPILPVAIKYAAQVLPMGKYLLNSGKISIKIGQPALFSSLQELQSAITQLYEQI